MGRLTGGPEDSSGDGGPVLVGLNGGADFHARDVAGLGREGAASLKVFLEMCEEDGVEPRRQFSGRFNVRLPPELHADVSAAAAAHGKSLDQWITDALNGCDVSSILLRRVARDIGPSVHEFVGLRR